MSPHPIPPHPLQRKRGENNSKITFSAKKTNDYRYKICTEVMKPSDNAFIAIM